MKKRIAASLGLALTSVCAAGPVEFQSLTQACEEALALSALPADLRDQASVYVWRGDEFERTVTSDGGFHCVVQRNHPDAIIPECITSTGKDSILEGIMARTKLVAGGMEGDAADEAAIKMIENGEIAAPSGPGVNYMMSAYNRIYTSRAQAVGQFPPHTMYFAPDAKPDVIGGSYTMALENKGSPFVVEASTHSYIVTFTEAASDSADVEKHCAGQIDVESRFN